MMTTAAVDLTADERQELAIDEWARALALTLPPMTPEEIDATGRLAAQIDAQRRAA